MIGVVVRSSDRETVEELFELFKTPWEWWQRHRDYDVVLAADDVDIEAVSARLVVIYSSDEVRSDRELKIERADRTAGAGSLAYKGRTLPIYGGIATFLDESALWLTDERSGRRAAYTVRLADRTIVRIGYDLIGEVRSLLTIGQPAAHAAVPTLDRHIELLRDLIVEQAPPLVEIPPIPAGFRFVACLTHDVDHALMRRHRFDHTMLGFLHRAVLGSLVNAWNGRASLRRVVTNWGAAARLPLVYCGLAKDPWQDFDRYTEIEGSVPSTFFIIPFAGRPGSTTRGRAPHARAARYGAVDVGPQVRRLVSAGREVGVHGIDAWRDGAMGRLEREEVRRAAGVSPAGVRMHWLYSDGGSPAALEKAGFEYDSTVGYNETVGFRAGTSQVYRLPGATRLMELPLHAMDTALFYPRYLDLGPDEAVARVVALIEHAWRHGGTVTVNWHDRSIAPERLWGETYVKLVDTLRAKAAWFATASTAVAWFRTRRSAAMHVSSPRAGELRVRAEATGAEGLPALTLRVHGAAAGRQARAAGGPGASPHTDFSFTGSIDTRIPI